MRSPPHLPPPLEELGTGWVSPWDRALLNLVPADEVHTPSHILAMDSLCGVYGRNFSKMGLAMGVLSSQGSRGPELP